MIKSFVAFVGMRRLERPTPTPGIEPFVSVYSNSLNDCTFSLYLL